LAPASTRPVTYSSGRLIVVAATLVALIATGFAPARAADRSAEGLSPQAREALDARGFVAVPQTAGGMRGIYEDVSAAGLPPFVTTDSVLLTTHKLLDRILYSIEDAYVYDLLEELSRELVRLSEEQYYLATDSRVKEAARRNSAFFAVGLSLLDPDYFPSEIALGLTERELELIEEARAVSFSPIMGPTPLDGVAGPGEDYSAYTPTGHYASSDRMDRFYRAVTWYRRMAFALPEGRVEDPSLTIQALLVARALESEAGVWLELWERLHEPLAFFAGGAGDPTVRDYIEMADEVFGEEFEIDALADDAKLLEFIEHVSQEAPAHFETHQLRGMRFLAQRFYPDVPIFDRLADPEGSGLGSTIDVMALLGSRTAREVAEERDAFGSESYRRGFEEIELELDEMTYDEWTRDLSWSWLHSLGAMLAGPPEGAPAFMQTSAWDAKVLSTASASWACLRDGCFVPSAAAELAGASVAGAGFIEPYPELYARLRELLYQVRDHLWNHYLLDEDLNGAILRYCEFLTTLERWSVSYLEGDTVARVPPELTAYHRTLVTIADTPGVPRGRTTARDGAFFVSVAQTNFATGSDLQVGIGPPDLVLARVPLGGEPVVCSGGALSFYEFASSGASGPTAREWAALVRDGVYDRPEWASRYLVP